MIIEVFGAKEKIFNFISLSNELPQTFVPIYFGEDEGVIDKDKYVDRGRFKKFVNDNPLGFFLYSDYCQMDITFSGIDSSIFIVKFSTLFSEFVFSSRVPKFIFQTLS